MAVMATLNATLTDNARILGRATQNSLATLRAVYTWRTWAFVWLLRILCQVSMFGLLGRLLGSDDTTSYLLIGNAVFMVANVATQVVNSTSNERWNGMIPLLVAAPAAPLTVFAGLGVQHLVDGVGVSVVSLFVLTPLFGVHLAWPAALIAVPLLVLTAVASYCYGLVLAALALRTPQFGAMFASIGGLSLMVLTGVQVPTSFWPTPVRLLTDVLPLTHGLHAVRDVLAGRSLIHALSEAGLEALVGVAWLVAAGLVFRQFAESGRRSGAIEFGG
jgi:ABC-2 type transport system permease protein